MNITCSNTIPSLRNAIVQSSVHHLVALVCTGARKHMHQSKFSCCLAIFWFLHCRLFADNFSVDQFRYFWQRLCTCMANWERKSFTVDAEHVTIHAPRLFCSNVSLRKPNSAEAEGFSEALFIGGGYVFRRGTFSWATLRVVSVPVASGKWYFGGGSSFLPWSERNGCFGLSQRFKACHLFTEAVRPECQWRCQKERTQAATAYNMFRPFLQSPQKECWRINTVFTLRTNDWTLKRVNG